MTTANPEVGTYPGAGVVEGAVRLWGREAWSKSSRLDLSTEQPQRAEQPVEKLIPQAIQVDYWEEPDGTWTALSPALGVSASAATMERIFPALAASVEKLWGALNRKFDVLPDNQRRLLNHRLSPLSFRLGQPEGRFSRFRGHLVNLAGQDPDELLKEMRGG
jgi:hypothetical protein